MTEHDHETKSGKGTKSEVNLLELTAGIVSAYVSNNTVAMPQMPELIHMIYNTLGSVEQPSSQSAASGQQIEAQKPAVSIRRSIAPDYIICLEDGKKLKMLKRHLRTVYDMTPDQYRAKWNLPADYPMVAPNYAAQRSVFAKRIGLGKEATGRKTTKKRG